MKWRFWQWLFVGLDSKKPGFFSFVDGWLIVHIIVALALSYSVSVGIKEASATVLLPLASIFIGLSFAWAGNAQALLQESEIEKLTENHPDGIESYLYTFQLAILVILITLVAWGMAGLGLFEAYVFKINCLQYLVKFCLYFLASITLRECWHVVLGSQIMILSRYKIRKIDK